MKKIMISLLLVAATMNVMAATVAGMAKVTIKGVETGKYCALTIAELSDGVAGLNPGYYGELNEEGKDVQMYVTYGGKKYQTFGSNATTMADLQLGIKTDASTSYTLTATSVTGTPLKIMINGVTYTITAGMSETITLPASSTLPAAGDEAKYKVQPVDPAAKAICFVYNTLQLTKYDGAIVNIYADGGITPVKTEAVVGDAQYDIPLSALASGKYLVKIAIGADNEEYVINVKPAVTVVP
jgi:hypothetical protein